jgi:hypothetical protein
MKRYIHSREIIQRIKNWIVDCKVRIFLILLLYPNFVCFTPDSTGTSNTFVDFMLGLGKYADVTYNCQGQATSVTKYSYVDYGVGVTQKIDIFNIGMRGGGLSIDDAEYERIRDYPYYQDDYTITGYSTIYINPYVGLNTKYFGLNAGVLWFSNSPTYGNKLNDYLINEGDVQITSDIRIGNKEAFHYTSQYLSSIPLLSGSIYDMGFGFGSKESRTLTWVGLSVGPFQNAGLSVKQNIQLTKNFDLLLKGRIGQIESNLEGSISAGVRYNL